MVFGHNKGQTHSRPLVRRQPLANAASSGGGVWKVKNGFARWYEDAKRAMMVFEGVSHEDPISPQRIIG
jgi:hypothetical protein